MADDNDHGTNGGTGGLFRQQLSRIDARMDRYDSLLGELPRLGAAVDSLSSSIRELPKQMAADRASFFDALERKSRELHDRIDKETSGRSGSLRIVVMVSACVVGAFGLIFTVSTFGVQVLNRPTAIEAAAARDLLAANQDNQAKLAQLNSTWQDRWGQREDQHRREITDKYDAALSRIADEQLHRGPTLQKFRDDIDAHKALDDERYAGLVTKDADLLSMVRSGMQASLDGVAGVRKELQSVRDDVNAIKSNR